MDGQKSKYPGQFDSGYRPTRPSPPVIDFPDPPNKETSLVGGILRFNGPEKRKHTSDGGHYSSNSQHEGSSRSGTEETYSEDTDEMDSEEPPGAPPSQYSDHGYEVPDIPFIQAEEPSPPQVYELNSMGNFIPVTSASIQADDSSFPYEMGPSTVITETPVFSGFGFSATDVGMAIQCAQVQGMIYGSPGRLRPPPGVEFLSRPWLLEAIEKTDQHQAMQDTGNSRRSSPKRK